MSHFAVLVIGQDVERQLQPFHEYECTGIEDEFVQDVDRTAEALADFEAATVTRFQSPTGEIHDQFDVQGNWKPEFSVEGKHGRRERSLPPGWAEVRVPAKDHKTAAEWISSYYGWNVLPAGATPGEDHRCGRIELDAEGKVARCIDRTNPNKKWDWWVIGGRWAGYFKLKPGAAGVRGENGLMGSSRNAGPGYADQVLKGNVDFDAMRRDSADKAGKLWDRVHAVTGELNDFNPWAAMLEKHPGDIEAARTAYREQRSVKAIAEATKAGDDQLRWIELANFTCTREEYTQRAANGAACTFAVLKDGQWYERGSMGWWGCVSDEKDADEWHRQFAALFDGLPDDTLLTVVDCHI